MNNLNLNDKRVRDALITLLNNEEFNKCDIATDYLGIEWLEKSQILMAPITNKNLTATITDKDLKENLQDWRVSAVIHYGNHFTWVATGSSDWNEGMILDDNNTNFEEVLRSIQKEYEFDEENLSAYDEEEDDEEEEA
jgi:hypothetical protein